MSLVVRIVLLALLLASVSFLVGVFVAQSDSCCAELVVCDFWLSFYAGGDLNGDGRVDNWRDLNISLELEKE